MKTYLKKSVLLKIVVLSAVLAAAGQDFSADKFDNSEQIPDYSYKNDQSEPNFVAAFTVNDNGDATDAAPGNGVCETAAGSGLCTLRAAITEANALAGDDSIGFGAGITSISVSGQIVISSNIIINGTGAGVLTVQNIAVPSTTSRVFDITGAQSTVTISGMTISGGGVTTGDGGGIRSAGILTVNDCIITNNVNTGTANNGGGIRGGTGSTLNINNTIIHGNRSASSAGLSFAGANLSVNNSVIRGNGATNGNGGGANIAGTVSVTITNSTFANNTALNSSGGFFINRGTVSNTTVSGNTANGTAANGGGGVRIQAGANTVSFVSCTITNNNAPNAATGARSGLWTETGTINLSNTIIAANIAQDIQRDGTSVIASSGFNLIGENTSVTTEFPDGLPNGTNYVGTDASPLSPGLAPLAANGGITLTHAFTAGSIAIDKGNSFTLTNDQRGLTRPVDFAGITNTAGGNGADIGAFEAQLVSVSGRVFDSTGAVKGAIVSYTDATNTVRGVRTNTFGYFRFENVESAQTYTFNVTAKGGTYASQMIFVGDHVSDIVFSGL